MLCTSQTIQYNKNASQHREDDFSEAAQAHTTISWAVFLIIMAPATTVACVALFRALPKPPAIQESLA